MEYANLDGFRISYQTYGKGPPLVWTPGGWAASEVIPGELLKNHFTIIAYDRPNSGESDIIFDESISEWDMGARYLHLLLQHLDCGPAYITGGSGGAMSSLAFVKTFPEDVKALYIFWPPLAIREFWLYAAERRYFMPASVVEETGLVQSLYDIDYDYWLAHNWPELRDSHPNNSKRIEAYRPEVFIDTFRRWGEWMQSPNVNFGGLTEEDLINIRIPTAVSPGFIGDDYHPDSAAMTLAQYIPSAQLIRPDEVFSEMALHQIRQSEDDTVFTHMMAKFFFGCDPEL